MNMTYKIFIKGLVQGVGFRPFIYKLAIKNNLVGYVDNNTQGVEVVIRCSKAYLERFINLIKSNKPQVAVISDITFTQINDNLEFEGFKILPSKFIDGQITRVSADIATCKDCLEDFKNQKLRINYPLINCTNCGPRFSIVKKIPYDRCNTTMNNFTMCPNCKHEYNNPLDRRFHAQPISCNLCGQIGRASCRERVLRLV